MNGRSVRAIGRPGHRRGFTLIEIMIVTVIVAILAGIASFATRRVQVKAHVASVVADARILFHALEEYRAINYQYPNATSSPAFNLTTFEPLRSVAGYQGSVNDRLLNGRADAFDSPNRPTSPGDLVAGRVHVRGRSVDLGAGGSVALGLPSGLNR